MLVALFVLPAVACTKVSVGPAGPSKPGILRIATARFDNLNTVLSGGGSSTYLSYLWGAYLFLADDRNRLIPELAVEIPSRANGGISADGLEITYRLRRNIRWHDGAPFDARDVVFTWHAIMNPRNNVVTRLGYDKIASITIVDPHTFRLKLKEPYAPIIASFFGPGEVAMPILPQHILASLPDINQAPYNRKPVGTGPFAIESYDPGSGVRLSANEHYWRGPPKLRAIDYLVVPDPNTVTVMLRTGELDASFVSDKQAFELASEPAVRIVRELANEDVYLSFNTTREPFTDARLRRAIAMGVDPSFFVKAFQRGTGTTAKSDQPPFLPWYDPNVRAPAFDSVRAEQLLDSLGWRTDASGYRSKAGRPLNIVFAFISDRDPDRSYAPVFQDEMKRIHVAVTLKGYTYPVFYAQANQGGILEGGRYDMAFTGWVGGADPDDATLWMCNERPPLGYNAAFLCDPRVDAAEKVALSSYDVSVRRKAYWQIQQLLAEDVPVVFLSWQDVDYAIRDNVKNFRPGENYWASWNWLKD